MSLLREVVSDPSFTSEDKSSQLRVKESLALMETLSAWADEMLRLEPATLLKVMKLGAKIQGLLRDKP